MHPIIWIQYIAQDFDGSMFEVHGKINAVCLKTSLAKDSKICNILIFPTLSDQTGLCKMPLAENVASIISNHNLIFWNDFQQPRK